MTTADPEFTRKVVWGSALILVIMLLALWFTLGLARSVYGGSGDEDDEAPADTAASRPAQPGCPVAFTALQDFKGDKMCFGVGRYPRAPATAPTARFYFANGRDADEEPDGDADTKTLQTIASYQVRVGYVLEAFEEENFGGRRTIRAVGPAKKVLREDDALPFPGSLRVSFAR